MKDKSLFLNLGYKCNFNCVYCVIGGIQKEFNSDDFVSFKQIKNIDLDGYNLVWLTGGEPTMHPNFFEILSYFKSKQIDVNLQTNGSLLASLEFFNKIKEYNIVYQIPLNSYIPKIHNTLMRHPKAFQLAIDAIKNLVNGGFSDKLTVKIILTKLNYKDLLKTIIFLNDLGVKKFYIAYPVLKGNYKNYIDKLTPTYKEIKPFLYEIVELEKQRKFHYVIDGFPYCVIDENQYKNVWEIGQLEMDSIKNLDEEQFRSILDISNNCFKKYGERLENRDCNKCELIFLKEKLNNISFLHNGLDKEINANCLDNIHKTKSNSCLRCKYNLICSGVSKEYIKLFSFNEFKPNRVKEYISKDKILKYIEYVRKL